MRSLSAAHPIWSDPLLRVLSDKERQDLVGKIIVKKLHKAQVVYREGDVADGVYAVLTGCIALFGSSANGMVRLLEVLAPGQSFGLLPVLDGGPRALTAAAREPSTVGFLSRRDYHALLASRPEISIRVLTSLSAGMRGVRSRFEAAGLRVPARLAKLVLRLQEHHALPDEVVKAPSLRFSQRELAEMLGLSREWVSRELARWRDSGIVELRRSRLVLRDTEALQRIVVASKAA